MVHAVATLETAADNTPIARLAGTLTKPAAGVTATKPTTAPTQRPMAEGLRPRNRDERQRGQGTKSNDEARHADRRAPGSPLPTVARRSRITDRSQATGSGSNAEIASHSA